MRNDLCKSTVVAHVFEVLLEVLVEELIVALANEALRGLVHEDGRAHSQVDFLILREEGHDTASKSIGAGHSEEQAGELLLPVLDLGLHQIDEARVVVVRAGQLVDPGVLQGVHQGFDAVRCTEHQDIEAGLVLSLEPDRHQEGQS